MSKNLVVLASNNPGKLHECSEIFKEYDIEVVPQSNYSVPDVDETGLSFVENALLKARQATRYSELPAIADDSGIEVDVLDGEPGIYSARYAGKDCDDRKNLELLLKKVNGKNVDKPVARFQCVMVYLRKYDDPTPVIAKGTWPGYIINEPRGENGFGYDPIFYVPTHKCTSAELPPEVKNLISHRAIALRELIGKISTLES